jgi:hypothetical protein
MRKSAGLVGGRTTERNTENVQTRVPSDRLRFDYERHTGGTLLLDKAQIECWVGPCLRLLECQSLRTDGRLRGRRLNGPSNYNSCRLQTKRLIWAAQKSICGQRHKGHESKEPTKLGYPCPQTVLMVGSLGPRRLVRVPALLPNRYKTRLAIESSRKCALNCRIPVT